jgi:outer membrane protein TolC
MKKIIFLTFSLTTMQVSLADQLEMFLAKGLEKSFDIKEQNLKIEQIKNTQKNTIAQLLPTLSLSSSRSYSKYQTISDGEKAWSKNQSDGLSLNANWTIWNNFQNITDIKTANINKDSEIARGKKDVQAYVLKVIDNYLTYQLYFNQKKSTELRLSQASKALDEAKIQITHGSKTKLESLDAEIDIIDAQRDLLEISNNIEKSKRNLAFLLNEEGNDFEIPELKLSEYKPFYYQRFLDVFSHLKNNWKDLIDTKNPELRISKFDYEKSALSYSQDKLAPWPSLNVNLADTIDYSSYIAKNIEPANKAGLHNMSLSFSLTWQLWDWWSTPRRTQNSYKEFEISQIKFREDNFRIKNEVNDLIEQYELLEKSIVSSKLILEKAVKQFEFANVMYQYGKISLLSRQKAMTQLYDGQNEYESRLKNQMLTAGQILVSLGEEIYQYELP